MNNWIVGVMATILVAEGCLIAFPGAAGRNLAGIALIIAGLECALYLMRRRLK